MLDSVVSVCIHRHIPMCSHGALLLPPPPAARTVPAAMEQRGCLKKVREEGSVSNFRSLLKYHPPREASLLDRPIKQ